MLLYEMLKSSTNLKAQPQLSPSSSGKKISNWKLNILDNAHLQKSILLAKKFLITNLKLASELLNANFVWNCLTNSE